MDAGGWLVKKEVSRDSLVPRYSVIIPQSCSSVLANLLIHRLARQNGLAVLAALEDRRLRRLEMTLGNDGAPLLALVIRNKAQEQSTGLKASLVALAVYGIGSPGMVGIRTLRDYPLIRTIVAGISLKNVRGWEIVNYLPLEPKGYPRTDPGPNTVLVDDALSAVRDKLARALALNPGSSGLCALYGSRALEDERIAGEVARFCAGRKILFLEPLPTAHSLAGEAGRKAGCSYLNPDVYIGGSDSHSDMVQAFQKARAIAAKNGWALAMLPATGDALKALSSAFPKESQAGYQFVPVSSLIKQ